MIVNLWKSIVPRLSDVIVLIVQQQWVETQRYEWTKLQRATTSDTDEPPVPPPVNPGGGARPANPRLTPERLRRLESIGFEWKVKNKMKRYYDKQWDGMFQRLLDFKAIHGHCNVVSIAFYLFCGSWWISNPY